MIAKISYNNHLVPFKLLSKRILTGWFRSVLSDEKKTGRSISFIFCDDKYLLKLNKEFLQHDTLTDIITFDYTEDTIISGDIFISVDRVGENASKFSVNFENELHRVMVHGVLHLCGYKDKTASDKNQMRGKEEFYLKKLYTLLRIH